MGGKSEWVLVDNKGARHCSTHARQASGKARKHGWTSLCMAAARKALLPAFGLGPPPPHALVKGAAEGAGGGKGQPHPRVARRRPARGRGQQRGGLAPQQLHGRLPQPHLAGQAVPRAADVAVPRRVHALALRNHAHPFRQAALVHVARAASAAAGCQQLASGVLICGEGRAAKWPLGPADPRPCNWPVQPATNVDKQRLLSHPPASCQQMRHCVPTTSTSGAGGGAADW
jgi:hypothetical protein